LQDWIRRILDRFYAEVDGQFLPWIFLVEGGRETLV
jgi:hypothetical protein